MRYRTRGPTGRHVVAASILSLPVCAFLLIGLASARQPGEAPRVLETEVDGPITPVVADHLEDGIEIAAAEGYAVYLIELDTPGGLDSSMRDIIQAVLSSRVPVVVYVAPQGARAASAGAFITLSSHVAAMAPGTSIGAATPVDLQDGEVSDKVVNDAVSYARALAELKGRDVTFAVEMVEDGRSIPASEAAEIGAVDLLASSQTELLEEIDGRTVELGSGEPVTLRTADAVLTTHEMDLYRRTLQLLADPNLAFLFLSIGTLAIIYEVANPGIGFGAIAGVILLLLALFSLAVLPVTAIGIALLILAVGLFVAELFAPGIGVFAAGGVISLVLAGVFLFRGSIGVDPMVIVPTAIVAGLGTILAGRLVWKARRMPQTTGAGGLVGERGTVRSVEGVSNQVFVAGAWWTARSERPLTEGESVKVVAVDGLDLIVEKEEGR